MDKDYEYRSEILTVELRRDEVLRLVWACRQSGAVGLAIDLEKTLETKQSN